MAYQTETEKYAQEAQQYLNDVHQAKTGGRFDKYVPLRDPLTERYSQAADDQQQLKAIIDHDRMAARNAQDAPGPIEFSQDELTPGPDPLDFSEELSGSSTGKSVGEVYQSHRPDWNAAPKTAEHPVAKEAARVLNTLTPITNIMQEIAAPIETFGDYFRGAMSPKTVLPGIGREGSYAGPMTPQEYNPSVNEAAQAGDPITALIREMATGLVTNPLYAGMSPLLRKPVVPKVIPPIDLKVMSAEEMLGGVPVEIPRPAETIMESLPGVGVAGEPLAPQVRGYRKEGTGRFVLPTGAPPSITDLTSDFQARILEDTRTGAFHDPDSPPMPVTQDTVTPARTDRLLGTESEVPDVVQPLEKSRALRSAEEILQERQRLESKSLHGQRDMQIREAQAYIPLGSSESATQGVAEGATEALRAIEKRDSLRSRKQQLALEAEEKDRLLFTKDYIDKNIAQQKETLKSRPRLESGELPRNFDHLSAESMFPSVVKRIDMDTLAAIGEFGPAWKAASESIRKSYEVAARESSTSIQSFTDHVANLLGRRSWFTRKGIGFKELTEGENVAIASAQRAFKLTPEMEEAAFNYLYTKGTMLPSGSMSMADREKAIEYAELVYNDMLRPTSEHPGVRQIKITDPFSGDEFEPGLPSMFVAHQPIKEITRDVLHQKQWEALYHRMGGQEGTKGDLEMFITRIVNFSKRDPEIGVGMFNMPNLEQKRMLDLAALGGSPYQHAKKLGYETDIFAMAVRHSVNGTLRGELQLLKPGIDALKASTTGLDKEAAVWLEKAINYSMKVPHGADQVQKRMTQALQAGRRWADMTLLSKAFLSNMVQFAYPLARTMGTPVLGVKANLTGVMDYVFGGNKELIQQSGALLPTILNEYSHPTGPLAVFHANTMRAYGMPLIDKQTRLFAGQIGNRYVNQLEKYYLANPSSKTHAALLNEMGGPKAAETILREGKVNDALRLEMIQRFSNNTAGVLDARGLPWYATSENPYAKAVIQYKPFLMANSTEINRSIINAPTKAIAANRFAALIAMGGTAGVGVYEAKQLFNQLVQGPDYEPSRKDAQYALEAFVGGFSGAYTLAAMDVVSDPYRAGAGLSVPMLSYPTGLGKDLIDSVKHGPGWRSLRTVSEIPVLGTVTGPYVKGKAKTEAKRLREAQED